MKEIIIENEEHFDSIITDGVCLVDFYADWCGPCKMLAPVIEEIAEEYDSKVKVCKVNVDDVEALAYKYNVRSIPTLVYFKDNKLVNTNIGFQSKSDIVMEIEKLLSE